jgi:hypothetical protein
LKLSRVESGSLESVVFTTMSGVDVIHKRYDTTGIITSKTTRTTRKATPSIRKKRVTATTTRKYIIQPNSIIAKRLSQLLQPLQDSDSVATLLTTTCIEQEKLLKLDNTYSDDKDVKVEKASSLLSLSSMFDNEINPLRQKKINRKCTGWRYDVKNNTIAMSNAMDVAVQKYMKYHKHERDVHGEIVIRTTKIAETRTTSMKSRSTTPIRTIKSTETLLELSTTNLFDDMCSGSMKPQSITIVTQYGTKISHDSNNTNNNNPEEDDDDDDDDDRIIPLVLPQRPLMITNPTTTTMIKNKNYCSSVLEHATTNIVSDDSEIDVESTHISIMTATKKNILSSLLDGNNVSVGYKNKNDHTIPNCVLVSDTIKDEERMIQNFWSSLMELIQFHVTIQFYNQQQQLRSSNVQNKSIRCKKDIYELYKLSEPIPIFNDTNKKNNTDQLSSMDEIRRQIYNEFVYNYHGITKNRLDLFIKSANNNIRIHTMIINPDNANDDNSNYNRNMWIQINIGPSYDVNWKHSTQVQQSKKNSIVDMKKNKSSMEFKILVQEQQQYIAVTCNRMKSKTRYISYVVSAIEHAFNNIVTMTRQNTSDDTFDDDKTNDFFTQPIPAKSDNRVLRYDKYLSGIDPFELFRLAHNRHHGTDPTAITSKICNPLIDLHTAATGCIYDNSDCRKPSRKRVLDNNSNCYNDTITLPVQTIYHCDWNGITNASKVCWDSQATSCTDASSSSKTAMNKSNKKKSKTEHIFKCRMTMTGTNVAAGICALKSNGYMKLSSTLLSNKTNDSSPSSSSLLLMGDRSNNN